MTDYTTPRKPQIKPPILSIVASPGAGKTTLASLFPSPIFIQCDDNAESAFQTMPEEQRPDFFPKVPRANVKQQIKPSDIIIQQLNWIGTQEHQYKTVVIDTVTSMNQLLEGEVLAFDTTGAETIADCAGGFHKGYKLVATLHSKIRNICEKLRAKGLTVVFLAHTAENKVKARPDAPECTVYGLDMYKDSRPYYVNHSDAVLYIKEIEIVKGYEENRKGQVTSRGKVQKTGDRVLITSGDGLYGYVDAKNCFQIPNELDIPYGTNPILEFIPFFNQVKGEAKNA